MEIKSVLLRSLALLSSFFICVEFVGRRLIVLPARPVTLSLLLFAVYSWSVGMLHPYTDWTVFGDTCYALLLFLIAVIQFRDPRYLERVLLAWQAAAALVALYFLIQWLGWDFLDWREPVLNPVGSFLGNRNYMAFFLLCSYPYALYLGIVRRGVIKAFALTSTILIVSALAVSESRISHGILIATLPLYAWYLRSRSRTRFWRVTATAGLFLSAGLLMGVGVFAVHKAMQLPFSRIDALTHFRLSLWSDTIKMIGDAPWIGQGSGCFQRIFTSYRSIELGYVFGFHTPVFNSHNVSLEIIAESGLIGLALFLILVAAGAGLFSMDRETLSRNRDLLFFSAVSLLGCALFSLVGEISHVLFCVCFSWLSLAILYNAVSGRFQTIGISARWKRVTMAALTGLGVLCLAGLIVCWKNFASNAYAKIAIQASAEGADPAEAARAVKASLAMNPRNPFALYQRAYASMQAGEFTRALDEYAAVRKIDPHFENIHYNIGMAHYQMGNYAKAIESLGEATRIYPTLPYNPFLLAKAYLAAGDYAKAHRWCEHLINFGYKDEEVLKLKALAAEKMSPP